MLLETWRTFSLYFYLNNLMKRALRRWLISLSWLKGAVHPFNLQMWSFCLFWKKNVSLWSYWGKPVVSAHPPACIKPIIHKLEHLLDDCKGTSYRLEFSTFQQTFSHVIITANIMCRTNYFKRMYACKADTPNIKWS